MGTSDGLDPNLIISHEFPTSTYTYTERDVALYALGIGACSANPVDDKELKYVYHQDGQQHIKVLPTFAALSPLSILSELASIPSLEYDPRLLLHGQQYIDIFKPFPSRGCLVNKVAISGLHDKGKAAVLEVETMSYEKESGALLFSNRMTLYLRGAGGFSKSSKPFSYSKYPPDSTVTPKIPESQPFTIYEESTQLSQALLYRLSGDYNPLHSDPVVAGIAGFPRPILHGLCTLGFAIRAIIKVICRGDPHMIKNITGRFLLHVFPGETLITAMWVEGMRVIYQVKVKERNKVVLSGAVTLSQLTTPL